MQSRQVDRPSIEAIPTSGILTSRPRGGFSGCKLLQSMESTLLISGSRQRLRDYHKPISDRQMDHFIYNFISGFVPHAGQNQFNVAYPKSLQPRLPAVSINFCNSAEKRLPSSMLNQSLVVDVGDCSKTTPKPPEFGTIWADQFSAPLTILRSFGLFVSRTWLI
jgi:hypothetical protein